MSNEGDKKQIERGYSGLYPTRKATASDNFRRRTSDHAAENDLNESANEGDLESRVRRLELDFTNVKHMVHREMNEVILALRTEVGALLGNNKVMTLLLDKFVTNHEFRPVKTMVYIGFSAVILGGAGAGFFWLVLKVSGKI